jgi:hypothetical protein
MKIRADFFWAELLFDQLGNRTAGCLGDVEKKYLMHGVRDPHRTEKSFNEARRAT